MADHNCSEGIREISGITTTSTRKKKHLKLFLEHLERMAEPRISINQRAEDEVGLILVTGN